MVSEYHSSVKVFDWLKELMKEADKMEEKPPYYHLVEYALRNGVLSLNEASEIISYLVNDQMPAYNYGEFGNLYGWDLNLKEED
jgi:hypothetical protein